MAVGKNSRKPLHDGEGGQELQALRVNHGLCLDE